MKHSNNRACGIRWFIVLLILMLPVRALAQTDRVRDQANLLTPEQMTQLQTLVQAYITEYDMDLIICTTDDAQGKTTMEYADDFYDENGYGIGEDQRGALLLIDMDNRMFWIGTEGGMIDIMDDHRVDELVDHALEYLKQNEYNAALTAAIDDLMRYSAEGSRIGQPLEPEDVQGYQEPDTVNGRMIFLLLGIAVVAGLAAALIARAIVMYRYKREFKPTPYDFRSQSRVQLLHQQDVLVNQFTTVRVIPRNDDFNSGSSSDSYSSTTHTSSSGDTHGGGGGSF